VPDRYIRPAIAFAILASGLKYVGLDTTTLGWALCGTLLIAAGAWLVTARPWTSHPAPDSSPPHADEAPAASVGRT
jgi:hypothetical protein